MGIHTFIRQNFYVPDDIPLTPDASLLESGIVDSTGVLEIVAHLEMSYGIQIDDLEIIPENLDSIRRIEAYLARKRQEAPKSA